jgi:hypothetical protein
MLGSMKPSRNPPSALRLLLRKVVEVVWPTNYFYRPEKHYMRGPGPKSLSLDRRKTSRRGSELYAGASATASA